MLVVQEKEFPSFWLKGAVSIVILNKIEVLWPRKQLFIYRWLFSCLLTVLIDLVLWNNDRPFTSGVLFEECMDLVCSKKMYHKYYIYQHKHNLRSNNSKYIFMRIKCFYIYIQNTMKTTYSCLSQYYLYFNILCSVSIHFPLLWKAHSWNLIREITFMKYDDHRWFFYYWKIILIQSWSASSVKDTRDFLLFCDYCCYAIQNREEKSLNSTRYLSVRVVSIRC